MAALIRYILVMERHPMNDFPRITQNPAVMGGKPCIGGLRVTVGMIVGQIGAGQMIDDILAAYPYVEREDVLKTARYRLAKRKKRKSITTIGLAKRRVAC
jgi:uncharacterized protein (DUF433 family)